MLTNEKAGFSSFISFSHIISYIFKYAKTRHAQILYASLHCWNIETLHLEFRKAREPTSSSPFSTNLMLFSVRRLGDLYTEKEKKYVVFVFN